MDPIRVGAGILCMMLFAGGALAEAVTFQSLMDPSVLPAPQRGMRLEQLHVEAGAVTARTTGAVMRLDLATGAAVFEQRIGLSRPVARLQLAEGLASAEVTHVAPGVGRVAFANPRLDLRVNGDSLFMFHALEPLRIAVSRAIPVGFEASENSSHLILDEFGGFGLYCSDPALYDRYTPYGEEVAIYELPADAVLWVGVCPPRPYDWDRSLRDNVVWHWSREEGYPPDTELSRWPEWGNLALLQSEVMLWKDWNLAFEPRDGAEVFSRVRETLHGLGMRFMVYTSPGYFFKESQYESEAFNSFENFEGWPPLNGEGENMELFLNEIEGLLNTHQPDGLYFDGQYYRNPAALYALARRSRALVGEEGLLEWHSTIALGTGQCFLPHADAYVDFILRGEGEDVRYADFDYLRYFVSGYNASNSIGVLCNNGPTPTPQLIRRLLEANCRMHTLVRWLEEPALMTMVAEEYRAKLMPGLREAVELASALRQEGLAARTARLHDEDRALHAPPAWTRSVMTQAFTNLPDWESFVSDLSPNPFSIDADGLLIHADAHTHAFFQTALTQPVSGVVVKLKQGTDGGMSWGPAVFVGWENGRSLRMGLRSDGRIQVNRDGREQLFDGNGADQWHWLRARWLGELGVVEHSLDGANYRTLLSFRHGGGYLGNAAALLVGKVPYDGQPHDHSDPGEPGVCAVGEVVVY